MTALIIELNFELCRLILLKMEELRHRGMSGLPRHFYFEGYTPENISYNISKLFSAKLIYTKAPQEWHREQLSIWPTGFTKNGWKFLEAAKDEAKWAEAVKIARAENERSRSETLKPLKVALFAGARRDA